MTLPDAAPAKPGIVDQLSASAFRLQTYRDERLLGTATGFFYRTPSTIFLVTNYHVLSGYNPLSGQPLHPQGALPNRVEFHLPTVSMDEAGDRTAFHYRSLTPPLLEDDGSPRWIVHPTANETVDVAALDLGQEKVVKVWTINDACTSQDFDDFELRPGLDVFVIGFPLGLRVAKHLAIWKRGTIASEPMFDVEGKLIILIDTATRSGMSGAPVIAQITGMWLPRGQADLGKARFGIGRSFLGIYSGRFGQDEFKAQLGIVWKKQVIDEIVLQGRMLDIKTASEAIPGDSDSFAATE
jgi:Trypsin-like peptidase domain